MDEKGKPDTVSEVAAATVAETRDAAVEQYDSWVRAIRREPLKAVTIAAGVEFVLALIVR